MSFNAPLQYTQEQDRSTAVRKLVVYLGEIGLFRSCLNCADWNDTERGHANTGCAKYQKLPPPKVIVVGCEDHSDLIPF